MIQGHCYSFCGIVTIYFSLLIHTFASPTLHFCRHDQRDALLEFKDEFPTDASNLSSWNKSSDCCLWSGVTCHDKSGQVISLDLLETPLNGSLTPNSSLFRLHYLRHLNLSNCNLQREIPSSLGNLSYLTNLDLSANHLVGAVPTSIGNLNELRVMSLNNNSLTGNIPISFTNLTKLHFLNLDHNRFVGSIPESISKFHNLRQLYLSHNNFTGSIPRSLSKLVNLKDLHLSKNKLEGEVPGFLWRLSTMMICHNSFSSFETPSQETLVQVLDLSSNSFQGPLPHWICNLKWLSLLDLSNNLFNGSIPTCLKNSIGSLLDMSLRNNSFSGSLPDVFNDATKLRSLDVSFNQLEGKFPKSLINCKALQLVNVGSNRIKDEFPSWLGSLPSLNVLSLRSNEFYGPLYHPQMSIGFQSLRVIDISHNDFSGTLPRHYFLNWREMTTLTQGNDYMVNPTKSSRYMGLFPEAIYRSMEMVNKGVETRFDRIRQDFRAIDFSGNRISGKIPESIGFLKGLRLLNLSDNVFTSDIPRSLANLTSLEALDLSCNKLSGQIPQNLGDLAFLSYMNFSNNLLQGPMPQGTQFERQNCSSFLGNSELYGLEEICEKLHALNPTVQKADEYSEAEEEMFSWVAAAIAYGPGVFCGLVIGHIFTSHNKEWLTEKFSRSKPNRPNSKCSVSTSLALSNKHF